MIITKEVSLIISLLGLFIVIKFYRKFNRHKHNQKKSKKLLKKIQTFDHSGQVINYLRTINPYVFEELILDSFSNKGWNVIRNKKYSGDGGIDGKVISPAGEKFLIQAKRYKGYINPTHVSEFRRKVIKEGKVKGGFFVHTGKSGKASKSIFSETRELELISGDKLIKLIKGE